MSKNIQILTEGQEGYGILIEKDAGSTIEITKELIIIESTLVDDGIARILIDCILQKANVKNRNGRIYPKHILEREVQKYLDLIKTNSSFGECVDELTEIFTTNGWKFIKDISDEEEIYTLNIQTNQLEKEVIQAKVDREYSGKMYHIHNKASIDMMVTPNHNMLIYDRYGKPFSLYAEEFVQRFKENIKDIGHCNFKKGEQIWVGNDIEYFEFDGIKVESELFMAFIGIWLAEGSVKMKKGNAVSICQVKDEQTKKIKELLDRLPFEYKHTITKTGKHIFSINNKELNRYCRKIGICSDKYIPQEIKDLNPKLLNILLEWMLIGDGSNRKKTWKKPEDIDYLHRELYTTSYKLAEDTSEIMMKIGNVATIKTRKQKDREIDSRIIKAENSKLLYVISEGSNNKSSISTVFLNIDEIEFNSRVYCVKTKNTTWLMRRNGKIAWTHNCNHPETPTISLKQVDLSHLIKKVWWEGDTLYGTIELITSKKFHNDGTICCVGDFIANLLQRGYKLGISSRGLGSVKKIKDANWVQDDFEIICWDLVSSPSTPDAYLYQEVKRVNESFSITKNSTFQNKILNFLNKK